MESPVQHIQVPMTYKTQEDEITIDYDRVHIARLAVKMKLLDEIDELERKLAN